MKGDREREKKIRSEKIHPVPERSKPPAVLYDSFLPPIASSIRDSCMYYLMVPAVIEFRRGGPANHRTTISLPFPRIGVQPV